MLSVKKDVYAADKTGNFFWVFKNIYSPYLKTKGGMLPKVPKVPEENFSLTSFKCTQLIVTGGVMACTFKISANAWRELP